jgi:hypothetical protein
MRKISLRRAGFHPLSLADVEKAAFWLVVELDTGWHNDCSKRRRETAEIKRSTFAARRQEC